MKKYLRVIKNTWEEMLTYRLNFVMWRLRLVVFLLSMYYLWEVIIPPKTVVFGYSHSLILTYILGLQLLSAITQSTRTHSVADDITQGNLPNYLIRPISHFFYWFSKDLGDKAMNIFFSIIELTILFFFLQPPLFIQQNLMYLIPFFLSVCIGIISYFFLGLLFSFIGFWSSEVWAPRFIYMMISSFLAGVYFPLDILPQPFYLLSQLLPFGYFLYFPLKIYLGQLSVSEIYNGLLISFLWTVILYGFAQFVWKRGLQVYTAQGK